MIKTALISVSDKTWIVKFANILTKKNIKIISTWWTAKHLKKNWINTVNLSNITWFPEMMNWRVKTLHPKIHWWLLALRNNDKHLKQIKENDISLIDLVIVNLYPFKSTVEKKWVRESEAIEQIDIWWPSMIRSSAKNFESVTVICDPNDLAEIWKEIQINWDTNLETRKKLAIKVFDQCSKYDAQIAKYLSNWKKQSFFFEKKQDLRYWENPHQKAMFLAWDNQWFNISNSVQIQWKELSYNNIMDADLAWQLVSEFENPCVSIIKHATPCWVAIWNSAIDAFDKAYEVDKISPFWWIIAVNTEVWKELAEKLIKIFLEIVIAPSFSKQALEIFKKKEKLRILESKWVKKEIWKKIYRKVWWWLLIQDRNESWKLENLKTVTVKSPLKNEIKDMQFAWKVIKYVKSNAIVIAKNWVTIWIWCGQTNRVKSVRLALEQANENNQSLNWAVLISDAFFPFSDWIECIDQTWITSILQPWWSIKDDQVIKKADEIWVSMVFCWERAFLH